ncbi:uncharacterized protein K02A2.6-like [Toxorhynchites rutilus septentrionalis]|uniref:uncharacterized protein K02A2.6-like n=1 Tax=Toxorhynchites rutilus septentrionalis TaxID=329112 RepID=UPI00247A912A|nr:uncharacterized protein K02A2.6-like [Toxorhynchites rutilus septentrionalis]
MADIILERVVEECQSMVNLKKDTSLVEKFSASVAVHAVHQQGSSRFNGSRKNPSTSSNSRRSKSAYVKKNVGESKKEVNIVSVINISQGRNFAEVRMNHVPTGLEIDSVSDITIISEQLWKQIGQPPGVQPSCRAKTASGEPLDLILEFWCDAEIGGISKRDSGSSSNGVRALQSQFPKVFTSNLGLCIKTRVRLTLKGDPKPIFRPKRPVAYSGRMLWKTKFSVYRTWAPFEPVDHSDWAVPILVMRKSNSTVRICAEFYTGLNYALEPNQYPLPLPEDIFEKMAGCSWYSHIDLSDAYLQVEVDPRDQHLLTINTHKGLFRYTRITPSIKSAPGAFQQSRRCANYDACKRSFDRFRDILQSPLALAHYNPKLGLIASADASQHGIGARIPHQFPDGTVKAISYVSRSLTPAESNYSQIEEEGLALIFTYVKTESFGYADILSRLINTHVRPNEEYVIASIELEDCMQNIIKQSLEDFPVTFKMVQNETQSDSILKQVALYIQSGWLSHKSDLSDPQLQQYYQRKDSLSVVSNCVLYGERSVIPSKFRTRVLRQLHKGHPGVERMRSRSSFVHAPNAKATKTSSKVILESWPSPQKPWQRVHADYAGPVDDFYYLIVVDAFSKWPEVIPTKRITTDATLTMFREIFATHGMSQTLVTDNGRQFISEYFERYCEQNGILHLKTPPYHPQSNGLVERFVDTFKRTLKKITSGEEALREA